MRNARLPDLQRNQGEGNLPNEFCQLVEIPWPLVTLLCKQVPTLIKAEEPIAL